MENSLRVASWNIWTWEGKDPEGIAEVIKENDIDIVGVQEGATYFEEDGEKWNMVEEVAKELGYEYEFYPALDFRPDKPVIEGDGIISRYPIKQASHRKLNPEDVEYDGSFEKIPRIAVKAIIDTGERDLTFLSTHLQYAYKFQTTEISRNQVNNLLDFVEESEEPVILTGDFNSKLESEEIQMLEGNMERIGTDKPTWTTQPFEHQGFEVDELKYRLDNIFVSDNVDCEKMQLVESKLSDHLMVVADVKTIKSEMR